MPSLPTTIQRFARRLRREFRREIERDAHEFKRHLVRLLKAELPPGPGRPRTEPVTHAAEMLAEGRTWRQIYAECLPHDIGGSDSRQLTQYRLRCAVRSRRNMRRRRKPVLNCSAKKI